MEQRSSRKSNLVAILFLAMFVPFALWDQSFEARKLDFLLELGGSENTIFTFRIIALISILTFVVIMFTRYNRPTYSDSNVRVVFVLYLGVYTFLSFLLTGIFIHPVEQYLYIVNIAAILLMLPSIHNNFEIRHESANRWLAWSLLSVLIIGVFAVIAINSHNGINGGNLRF
jgi:hypothetical protein